MRIERRKKSNNRVSRIREDLGDILESSSSEAPVCAPDCPMATLEQCSRHCPDVPRMLSSEAGEYPLEDLIAPLAYELKRLGVFHPCWSCEGHNSPDGKLWKKPQVWFYCSSVVHLRVLANAVEKLHRSKNLSVPWHVALTFTDDDNADSPFSLEPMIETEQIRLSAVQRDIITIAEHLRDGVIVEARKLSRMVL